MSGSQTTQAVNFTDASVEVSVNGGAWTAICGEASAVGVSGGDRSVSEFFTFCGDTPVVLLGKRAKIQLALTIAYTEGLADAYAMAENAYQVKGTIFQVRFAPKGYASGNFLFTSDSSYSFVSSHPYPGGAANSADVTNFACNVETSKLTRSVIP